RSASALTDASPPSARRSPPSRPERLGGWVAAGPRGRGRDRRRGRPRQGTLSRATAVAPTGSPGGLGGGARPCGRVGIAAVHRPRRCLAARRFLVGLVETVAILLAMTSARPLLPLIRDS